MWCSLREKKKCQRLGHDCHKNKTLTEIKAQAIPGSPWSLPLCRFREARSKANSVENLKSLSLNSSLIMCSCVFSLALQPTKPLRIGSKPTLELYQFFQVFKFQVHPILVKGSKDSKASGLQPNLLSNKEILKGHFRHWIHTFIQYHAR